MAARDYDYALVCCVKNTIDDHIMNSGASFHATYWKEELERFKLHSGKDVRYIPGLKKRLISIGKLDEEGYHIGFRDQQWKVTKGSLVVARGNKRGSLYMVEGMKTLASKGRIPDLQKAVVGFCEPCVLRKHKKADLATILPLLMTTTGRYGFIFLKINLRAKSMRLHEGLPKMAWEDSVTMGYKVVRSRDVAFNKDSIYGAKAITDSGNLTKPNQNDQVVLEDSPENLVNKSIVVEHGLSSKITQSPGRSSDMSEGSKNNRSFEDSGRSDEKDFEDRVSFEEGGSKTPQVRGSTRESRAPTRGFSVSWEIRKPRVQVEENSVRIEASTEIMVGSSSIILLLYVDDMLVVGFDMVEIKKLKRQLSQEFEMKDLGSAKMHMLDVGYWEIILRSVRKKHLRRRLLDEEWLRKEVVLEGFSDLDYGGCLDSGKSTTAAYMAIAEAGKELVWLKNFLKELDKAQIECVLFCDNQSAIHLAKNPVFHR
nr:retrovirus-related Pol polyprotein from transposon TNT 1-94 [Tanacetum cinerariifolium]